MAKSTGLDKLSALVQGSSAPMSPEEERQMLADEKKLEADVEKVLDYVAKLADGGIFDMQILVEACAEELRTQIRDDAEGNGDDHG